MLALDHVQIAAPPDCEGAARDYFVGIVGLEEIAKEGETANSGGCWFRTATVELHVGVQPDFVPARKAHPALRATSKSELDRLASVLAQAGYPVRWDARLPGIHRFFSTDPWGNRFEFLCPDV